MHASGTDPRRGMQRVADAYDSGSNGITAVRLFLALSVLFLHAWPIGGFGPDPVTRLTGGRMFGGGELAVAGFFGLSGFLLVTSRRRHGTIGFAWRRAVRILPAYWVMVALTTILVGLWYIPAAWLPVSGVGGVEWTGWDGHPLPLINASLWTLWPEILCYAALAVMPVRALRIGVPMIGVGLLVVATVAPAWMFGAGLVFGPLVAFLVGAIIALWPGRVPLAAPIAVAGAVASFVTVGTIAGLLMVGTTCAYAAIWAGARVPLRWKADLSYGTYIFAFPIGQILFSFGAATLGVFAFAGATALATLPVAAASWFLIERPALRAGARLDRRWVPPSFRSPHHVSDAATVDRLPAQPAAATSDGLTTRAPSS